MTDITELTSVQKNANIHRLSRLIAYAPNDELRQLAVEVEQYTDQLIEALEHYKSREGRVIKLVHDSSKSWDELVEALEKAQAKNSLVAGGIAVAEKLHERIAYLEKRLKGTEESLIAATDMVRELESRTVKLPEAFYPDGDIDCPLVVNLDDVKEILTTTGINWEAE